MHPKKTEILMIKKLTFIVVIIQLTIMNAYSQTAPFDFSGMDKSVKPGDDFNMYVNGQWFKNTEIPSDQSRWGSFMILREENNKRLRSIMEEAAANKTTTDINIRKIGDFFASAMDTVQIEKLGSTPMRTYMQRIDIIKNIRDLVKECGYMHTLGLSPLYSFYAYQDDKNSAKVVAQFHQPRLGLPEKGYYFDQDEHKKKIREAYTEYITKLFAGAGYTKERAAANASMILALETKLAGASKSAIELRDPEANYHKMSSKDFGALISHISFQELQASLLIQQDTFIVGQPDYFKTLNDVILSTPFNDLKEYLKFGYLSGLAPYLSKDFQKISFNFSKEFSGQKVQQERGKRMVDLINGKLGEMIGQIYVQKYFPPEAKSRMLELVHNLQSAYETRINAAEWMSDVTKKKAIVKLKGMLLKIGYPDQWKDYAALQISRNNFVQNIINSNVFEYNEMVEKLKKPVDKTEWLMSPAMVNAYYNPQTNEIAFPAGILQPPFFNLAADDAINYGAIGAVIGHEMTHGFDDQGRLYDNEGNLGDWWTAEDAKAYESRAQKVVDQYNAYTVYDTVHVKGELTLGENIADLGGLAIAFDAFKKTAEFKEGKSIDGYTPEQRFFLGFGQIWRMKNTQKMMLNRINTDPHSPEEFRIKGSVSNFTPWYEAWKITPQDKLYKPENERIKVW